MKTRAAVTLDMSGLSCPLPLLGAKKILDDLPDGQQMILISDCPGTGDDLRAWAGITGHEIVKSEPINGRRVAYTIRRSAGPQRFGGNVMLDMRGAACPGPIVEAERLLHGMRPGEVLVLIGNCPGLSADVEAWTANSAVELIDRFESAPGEFEFYLRRR
jgi:tRNA 2-thiouridine synthesizing protein A